MWLSDYDDGEASRLVASESHTVSTWAERYRELSRRQTARFGPWRNDKAPYLVGIMDLFNDPRVRELTVMKAGQVGVSEAVRNAIGYMAHMEPDPVLVVLPNQLKGREIMSERIIPLIDDTPVLKALKTRDRSDVVKGKVVLANGFTLWLGWSGSATSLASNPVRWVINDEVDKFEPWAGRESDPVSLGRVRTQTYDDHKIANISTPTTRDGLVCRLFEDSPVQLRWHVPCPRCGEFQVLTFDRLVWEKYDESDRVERAEKVAVRRGAWYECAHCKGRIDERQRKAVSQRGVWLDRGQSVDKDGTVSGTWAEGERVGVHLSVCACLWVKPWDVAATFIRAGRDPLKLQDFRNSWLGEVFEQQVERPDTGLMKVKSERAEEASRVPGVLPNWAGRVVMTADTQKDHFFYVVRAWGHGFRSVRVDHGRVESFEGLMAVLNHVYPFEDEALPGCAPQWMGIDTGGGVSADGGASRTDEVYRFGLTDPHRIKLLKGVGRTARSVEMPIRYSKVSYAPRSGSGRRGSGTVAQKYQVQLHLLDVDHWKDVLASRLGGVVEVIDAETGEVAEVEAWGLDARVDVDYERQMTSEQKVRVRKQGQAVERWQPVTEGAANHYWDCEVYQCALAQLMRVDHVGPEHELMRERAEAMRATSPAPPEVGDRGTRVGGVFGRVRSGLGDDRPYLVTNRD